jgi:hypothetical protein
VFDCAIVLKNKPTEGNTDDMFDEEKGDSTMGDQVGKALEAFGLEG